MAIFDPKQVTVILNGKEITDWADGSDVISLTRNQPAGAYTIGVGGTGVYVANPDASGKLVLKIKQHSEDNAYLSKLYNKQKSNIKSSQPITLLIRDLLNEDSASGQKGFFTEMSGFIRGNGHNAQTWTIEFESISINLEKGI